MREQVNAAAPHRSKASDGSIGDTAHQARRSDHNPDARGVVRAIDITDDPAGGFDAESFSESLRASHDHRIKYVIWNGRMFSSYGNTKRSAWAWGAYSGSNQHTHHIHISIQSSDSADADTSNWTIAGTHSPPPVPAEPAPDYRGGEYGEQPDDLDKPVLQRDTPNIGGAVGYLQVVLQREAGAELDLSGIGYGRFGPQTEQAVRTLQAEHGVTVDGIVGWNGPDGRTPGPQATWPIIDRLARDAHRDRDGDAPEGGGAPPVDAPPAVAPPADAPTPSDSTPVEGADRSAYTITSDDADGLIAVVARCVGIVDAPWAVRRAAAETVAHHNGADIDTTWWGPGDVVRIPAEIEGVRSYTVQPDDGLIAIAKGLGLGDDVDAQTLVAAINTWQGPVPRPDDVWYGGPR